MVSALDWGGEVNVASEVAPRLTLRLSSSNVLVCSVDMVLSRTRF